MSRDVAFVMQFRDREYRRVRVAKRAERRPRTRDDIRARSYTADIFMRDYVVRPARMTQRNWKEPIQSGSEGNMGQYGQTELLPGLHRNHPPRDGDCFPRKICQSVLKERGRTFCSHASGLLSLSALRVMTRQGRRHLGTLADRKD